MNKVAHDELISKFKDRVDLFCEALKGNNVVYLASQYTMLTKYLFELVEMSGKNLIKEHFEADKIQTKLSDIVASLSPGDSCMLYVKTKDNQRRESKFYGRDEELENLLLDIVEDMLDDLDIFHLDGINWLKDKIFERIYMD